MLSGKSLSSKNTILDKIAARNAASVSQIILSWLMSKNRLYPICRTINLKHIEENFGSTLIKLSDDEINEMDRINENSIVGNT